MLIADDPEYRALLAYAARIGRDPALVQGAGGNVSLKRDGILWVKASGAWLAEAESQAIMAPVRLDPMLAALHGADPAAAEDMTPFVEASLNPSGLRPSIETTMHGALPHPVVVHVHCVETMAWAARTDCEQALAPLLAGLRWRFVPYVRPGAPLTRAILAHVAVDADVLVLGSHGLVVGGADTATAARLLQEVARRLRRSVRGAPKPDHETLAGMAEGTPYRPAEAAAQGSGTDPLSFAVAQTGSLYPDHVIFLGPGVVTTLPRPSDRPAAMVVAPNVGVLLRRDASPGAAALARCLADVTARLHPSEPLSVLTAAQERELLGWDAEQYRQGLDRA